MNSDMRLADVEAMRAMFLDWPTPIPPEQLVNWLFILQDMADAAYAIEQAEARPPRPRYMGVFSCN